MMGTFELMFSSGAVRRHLSLIHNLQQQPLPRPRHGPDQIPFGLPVLKVRISLPHIKTTRALSFVSSARAFIIALLTWAAESGLIAVRRFSRMTLPVSPFLS